jgi:hypothetical protein
MEGGAACGGDSADLAGCAVRTMPAAIMQADVACVRRRLAPSALQSNINQDDSRSNGMTYLTGAVPRA